MKGKYLKGKTIEYDGSQLSPLWAYINADVQGDSKSKGTPVRTVGLNELGVEDVDKFAVEVARRFIEEMKDLKTDASKVCPVTDSCF